MERINGTFIPYEEEKSAHLENWLGTPPEYDHIDEELHCDVVVCGGGLAGVSAAREAAEQGADVVLFEKCTGIQCRSGDFGVIGSQIVREHWGQERDFTDQKLDIVNHLVQESGNRASFQIWKTWADEVGSAFDWYCGSVEDLCCLPETAAAPPEGVKHWLQPARYPDPEAFRLEEERVKAYPCTVQFCPDQRFVFQSHWEKALATGKVRAFMASPVKKLLRGSSGRVTGVIAEGFDGTVYRCTADRGVVLATGDYSSDENMLFYYNPQLKGMWHGFPSVDPEGRCANTGDGHKMAMWVGARMEDTPHATNDHNMGGVLGTASFLELNILGERFMNEDCSGQDVNNIVARLPGQTMYQIFDANWVNEVPLMAPRHGQVCAVVPEEAAARNRSLSSAYGYATPSSVEKAVKRGRVLKADTMEGLVDQMDMTDEARKTALASIRRYQTLAQQGADTDFGKTAKRLSRLETPPYYACKIGLGSVLCVHGGIECDAACRAYDQERRVIPGLYVCGNVMGGRYAVAYPLTVAGSSHSTALTFGRIAGRSAASGR